jgi:hypothetical protein
VKFEISILVKKGIKMKIFPQIFIPKSLGFKQNFHGDG